MQQQAFEERLKKARTNFANIIHKTDLYKYKGIVTKLLGLTVEARLPGLKIGDLCYIETVEGKSKPAEVVAFKGDAAQMLLLYDGVGISQGSYVTTTGEPIRFPVGDFLLGRLIDPLGNPLDGMPLNLMNAEYVSVVGSAPNPMDRPIISKSFSTGVRAIDSLLTFGEGQRMGLFAGSGVGKSTLLGMIARNSDADVNVMALIGERGREVKEFMENSLGPEGMKRSVLVCATGDKPPLIRQKCLQSATAVCEYFRDKGKKVFLMTDTITRCAMAGREVGLSIGEPPTMKGYPPSIFSWLQQALERTGVTNKGSITALYTVLMEGGDINDPVVDTVRGIVDGHVFLNRKIAEMNHYPAIDVLGSISRLFPEITTNQHQEAASKMRRILATYRENKDLVDVGMYQAGTNPKLDLTLQYIDKVNAFLQQRISDSVNMENTIQTCIDMMKGVDI
jgi:flagellum-specific ATP synthase